MVFQPFLINVSIYGVMLIRFKFLSSTLDLLVDIVRTELLNFGRKLNLL
jgi:hypothetical protein